MSVKNLIAKIKENGIIYRTPFNKNNLTEEQNNIWHEIANVCNVDSVSEAISMWQTILNNYRNYLIKGAQFSYANELQFMQAYIFDDGLYETSALNIEYDENELDRIINSEDEDEQCNVPKESCTNGYLNNTTSKNDLNQNEFNLVAGDKVTSSQEKQCLIDNTDKASIQSFNLANLSSLELIFLGYAKVVQSMPLPLQIQTKRKISNIMEEAESKLLHGD